MVPNEQGGVFYIKGVGVEFGKMWDRLCGLDCGVRAESHPKSGGSPSGGVGVFWNPPELCFRFCFPDILPDDVSKGGGKPATAALAERQSSPDQVRYCQHGKAH